MTKLFTFRAGPRPTTPVNECGWSHILRRLPLSFSIYFIGKSCTNSILKTWLRAMYSDSMAEN